MADSHTPGGERWTGPEGQDEATRTVVVTTSKPAAVPSRTGWVHSLVVAEGAQPGARQRLGALPLRLGRRTPCEWVLADAEISGLHCDVQLEPGSDAAVVSDHGSTNGSYVNGARVVGSVQLPPGALLQLGRHVLRHEYGPPQEGERADELVRDLETARRYVRSLLPPPMRQGPVRTEWLYQPSAQLGGDAFGYFQIDAAHFAGYLVDVSGHGVAAAMHSVSVLNVMRQRALPGVDFADPAQVLARLNAMFPMDEHGGLFFTMWYGVFEPATRALRYASAGHHPAYLLDPVGAGLRPLATRNPIVGALARDQFDAASVQVPADARLYLFSDGVFEIQTIDGRHQGLADFLPLLLQPGADGESEPERLHRAMRARARSGPLDDDVTLLTVTFLS